MICTSRMNRIVAFDLANRRVEVESGVVNLHVTNAVKASGYFYAPDPSSQVACTIGGNIAENSGGPHTLKYGVTTNHVLGVELVLAGRRSRRTGRAGRRAPGLRPGRRGGRFRGHRGNRHPRDAAGLCASRRRIARCWRFLPTSKARPRAVSKIIAAGIIPGAIEMMDPLIIRAVEAAFHVGFPADAGAVLIVELDGLEAGLDERAERSRELPRAAGASDVQLARDEAERALLWKARKRAFGAVGRLAPNYATQDGVVPRTRLPDILRVITMLSRHYGLAIGNVFHAGDGNIHPIVLYDERDRRPGAARDRSRPRYSEGLRRDGRQPDRRAWYRRRETAEMPLLFAPDDLIVMSELRRVFDPDGHANPNKVLPQPGGCVEVAAPRRQVPL